MAYKYLVAKGYNTKVDYLSDIWTYLEDMGWVLEDDQSADHYKVYKSNGELGDRLYQYIKIYWGTTDTIRFTAYLVWDSTNHSGGAYPDYFPTITTSNDTPFTGWIYGSKNLVVFMTKVGTTYYAKGFGHFDTKYLTVETDLTADAAAGDNATLTVSDTTGFVVGAYYQMVSNKVNEGRDLVVVSSITDSTHLVLEHLPRNYSTGAIIGQMPSTFGIWNGGGYFYPTCGSSDADNNANYNGTGTKPLDDNDYYILSGLVPDGCPNKRGDLLYYLQPIIARERAYWWGIGFADGVTFAFYNQDYILYKCTGSTEDIFYANKSDSGVATGGTDTTLEDTSKSWAADSLIGKVVVITDGTGSGQARKITDNDATSITVDTWTVHPDDTSHYMIVERVYRVIKSLACRECV